MKPQIKCIILSIILFIGCKNSETKKEATISQESNIETIVFQNKAHRLVHAMVEKIGNIQKLKALKNVTFTYTYRTPNGEEDVSREYYLFEKEKSLGIYHKHERTLPELKGAITQAYNGTDFWLKHNGKIIKKEELLKKVAFTRKTNYFWFAMMQKMLDPGMQYKYLKEETLNGIKYDVVKVGYKESANHETDIYQLYINKNTGIADQFLFTVVSHHIVEEPLIMKVRYKNIQGILIPIYRKYTKAKWDGSVLNNKDWVEEISENIEFDTNITVQKFNH